MANTAYALTGKCNPVLAPTAAMIFYRVPSRPRAPYNSLPETRFFMGF